MSPDDELDARLAELAAHYQADMDLQEGLDRLRSAGHGISAELSDSPEASAPASSVAEETRSVASSGQVAGKHQQVHSGPIERLNSSQVTGERDLDIDTEVFSATVIPAFAA